MFRLSHFITQGKL